MCDRGSASALAWCWARRVAGAGDVWERDPEPDRGPAIESSPADRCAWGRFPRVGGCTITTGDELLARARRARSDAGCAGIAGRMPGIAGNAGTAFGVSC